MQRSQPINVYLVCNARYHDTNFARHELLKLLAEVGGGEFRRIGGAP